ncbi:MAG: phosphoribosyltransferase family protein, partial [Synergistaceae bacterium]|nr:phosphoribosyltransferase family protein [Synergistaceae bacterium]
MEARLQIALRDSTAATRSYVIVNPLLAKHLPSVPSVTLEYFRQLGDKAAATCEGEHVLVIGFAETATAVGAAVACAIEGAVYVHTTRETPIQEDGAAPRGALVAEFLEEHSHARNQALYLREELCGLSGYDRLVFVEDEITTGKTILNFLRNTAYRGKITVSALVFNGFDESAFAEYDADFCCLQRVGYVHRLEFSGPVSPRSGIGIGAYRGECLELAREIASAVSVTDVEDRDVLVLGTEEFMYPALILGRELERTARSVKSHSTTRTPLLPR